jgi:hypothetical protein
MTSLRPTFGGTFGTFRATFDVRPLCDPAVREDMREDKPRTSPFPVAVPPPANANGGDASPEPICVHVYGTFQRHRLRSGDMSETPCVSGHPCPVASTRELGFRYGSQKVVLRRVARKVPGVPPKNRPARGLCLSGCEDPPPGGQDSRVCHPS